MSKEIFPFGLSDKEELKSSGDVSIFHPDGTPHLVDFSPRVTPQPVAPTQPVVAADPKGESAPEPVYSQGDATKDPENSGTPSEGPTQPVQPDATEATTPSKTGASSKPTSSPRGQKS